MIKKLEVIEVYKKIMIMDCLMMKLWAIVKIMLQYMKEYLRCGKYTLFKICISSKILLVGRGTIFPGMKKEKNKNNARCGFC